ncbi:hypothetical protein BOX15_Mlig000932g3, partial [Macrostomum lignano]
PGFEQTLILKCASRADVAAGLRSNLGHLLRCGAVIRSVDNLGERRLPLNMRAPVGDKPLIGHYFLVHFESPPGVKDRLRPLQRLDPFMIRGHVCDKTEADWVRPCSTGEQCKFGEKDKPNFEQAYAVKRGYRHY